MSDNPFEAPPEEPPAPTRAVSPGLPIGIGCAGFAAIFYLDVGATLNSALCVLSVAAFVVAWRAVAAEERD